MLAFGARARAELVVAESEAPIVARFPEGVPPVETQIVLQLVVDTEGRVESAVVVARAPESAPPAFDDAAVEAARAAKFRPSTRDGRPIRSRVEYVVVFHPEPGASPPAGPATSERPAPDPVAPLSTAEQDEDYAQVEVRGTGWASPRGLSDLRIKRELLDASPRQQTSELLSAAPGFFVDHEDGEGFGNDVYLRGFDLEHGSGIEMRVGNVPINSPVHVQGQGYTDANFLIPEVVRSIRVLEGPYDPRQGDAAIVGSAYFDLGVPDRGTLLKASHGSFGQMRLVGVTAPAGADEETFAAFALRKTDGFGPRRDAESGTVNAQYGIDLGERDHVRLLATAYSARASLPGVLRKPDVDAGAVSDFDVYPYFTAGQGVQSSRAIISADFDHASGGGARFEVAPWVMWTDFRARENFTGNIYSSALNPALAGGQGDLWETTNRESALGVTSRFHAAPVRLASFLEATTEPGVYVRAGHTDQTKSLLAPDTLIAWDRRLDVALSTFDAGAYLDVDLRAWRRLRLSGGVRADLLSVTAEDRLGYDVPGGTGAIPGATRSTQGVAVGPRATLEWEVVPELSAVASYGEGFRSLGANANVATSGGIAGEGPSIREGARPFSRVRSGEAGVRAHAAKDRFTATATVFETHVENELVFEASSGGFTTQAASVRRGMVASAVTKPVDWLLASMAASVSSSTFTTLVPGVSHFVPNVPPVLLRADVSVRGTLTTIRDVPLTGRVGVGYTFLAGRHLTDRVTAPSNHVLNAGTALRYGHVEFGVDAYNLLDLRYADDAEYYLSNWSTRPGTALATPATHVVPAPPLSVLASLSVYF